MMTSNEHPEKYGWWMNELKSLGLTVDTENEELIDIRRLESLADEAKQLLVHEYKNSYS